jgi:DnaJ domain
MKNKAAAGEAKNKAAALTPYAVLLVKPTDADEVVRKAYHAIVRSCHPDVRHDDAAKARWFEVTEAYAAVETKEARDTWQRGRDLMASKCVGCNGTGVRGTRMFKGKIHHCEFCRGVGV